MKANEILMQQIALDYCCSIDDVKDGKNHFTLYQELSDRRSFQEADKCFLKICVIMLITLIKNEILKRGILPFYGTSISHLASQRIALASGFKPAWVELITTKRSSGV